ncbi:MAG: IS5 family transposase [Acidobacteriaceae bacterium]
MEPVLRPQRREDNRGRPWHDTRAVLNGVFWVLGTGAQWRELPEKYPPYQTCHRRFQQWIRSGKLEEALKLLARHLHERGRLNLEEAFVDATFASAKKGAFAVGPTRRGKGTKIVAVAADNSLPLAVSVQSASPAECQLVEEVLAGSFLDELPARLIGDKAYDSDPLDAHLRNEYGIELIAPNRRGRKRRTQHGRKLRRYRKRWKVERLFAWMHNFRRLVTRWEYHIENFLGFVHLACLHMLLRHL